MFWKVLLGVARLLFELALAWMYFARASKQKTAKTLFDGRIEFAPNRSAFWAWPVAAVLLIWEAAKGLSRNHGKPLELMTALFLGLFAVLLVFSFPGTIVATREGLEQIYWLRSRKRIQWRDIVEIEMGDENSTVTVKGLDGTRIVHSPQLADRQRLLSELKVNCGDNLPPNFPHDVSAPDSLRIENGS